MGTSRLVTLEGTNDISVIIPSNHCHHDLLKIVQAICNQTIKPAEIVLVDSSNMRGTCPAEITALCANSGIQLIYAHCAHAMPGHARNIGFDLATSDLIAFLDVLTIPRPNWLEVCLALLSLNDCDFVYGSTCFRSGTWFETLVRDSFFGILPLITLPGSVFRRKVMATVGKFVGWVRAGEDTEWLLRLELLKVKVVTPSSAMVDYIGLTGINIKSLIKKWNRNYSASSDLPQFFPQKLVLWLIIYPVILLIAFNWNFIIADWHMESPLYIGHITKIIGVLPICFYIVVRGLLLPLQRGVKILKLIPVRFIAITFICMIGDTVKILVFSIPNFKVNVSTLNNDG